MNKKGDGGDVMMFFAFLFLIIIILTGLWLGIFAFFGDGYDFRRAEAEIMADKISNCFGEKGISKLLEGSFTEQLKRECGFNDNIEKERLVYLRNLEDETERFAGVLDYKNQCFFEGAERNRNYPVCVKFEFSNGEERFEVITGSKANERRRAA